MGSFYLSPESALIFAIAAIGWLVFVGVVGGYWIASHVPWDWPGGVNWQRVLVGSLVQGFFAAQIRWFAIWATHLNRFFVTAPPLPGPHPAVVSLLSLVTGPYWLSLSVFRDTVPMLAGVVLIYAAVYLAINLAGPVSAHVQGAND